MLVFPPRGGYAESSSKREEVDAMMQPERNTQPAADLEDLIYENQSTVPSER